MSASSRGMYWTGGSVVSRSVSARVVSATTRPLKRTRTRLGFGVTVIGCSLVAAMATGSISARRCSRAVEVVQPVLLLAALSRCAPLFFEHAQLHPPDLPRDRLRQLGELQPADALVRRQPRLGEEQDPPRQLGRP